MCLHTVKQAHPYRGDLYRTGTGWKVYHKEAGKFHPIFRAGAGNIEPGNGTIFSDDWMDIDRGYKRYIAGFHVFVNREDAEQMHVLDHTNRVICRVKWRGLCAVGTERGCEVLVVHEILSRRAIKVGE